MSLLIKGSNVQLKKFNNNTPVEEIDILLEKVTCTSWDVSDINYYSILHASDRYGYICSNLDYIYILSEYLKYDEQESKKYISECNSSSDNLLTLLWGLSRKQLWYQDKTRLRNEFNRQVEMLEVLSIDDDIDLNNACMKETGFSIHDYRVLLFALAGASVKDTNITTIHVDISTTKAYPIITEDNIYKVRNYITADCSMIRHSLFKEDTFYIWPIVRTLQGEYINTNQYMLYRKIAEGPLWAIRNYYKSNETIKFLVYYGKLFEKYVEKLMLKYIPNKKYTRLITKDNQKMADWTIETPRYLIIIEQKAFIPEIILLNRRPDSKRIFEYISRYEKAFLQLDSTCKLIKSSKTILKIILHYDIMDIANGIIKEKVLHNIESKLETKSDYYFMDIESFERLIKLYRTDISLLDRIFTEKRENDQREIDSGYEYSQILNKYCIEKDYDDDHWKNYFYIND